MNLLEAKCPKCQFKYTIPLDRELIRTIPQNKLYWSFYIKIIADHTGHTPDEIHEEMKLMFNPKDSIYHPGARVGGSTTSMTRKEFSDYLKRIRVWAWDEYSLDLPEPEDK